MCTANFCSSRGSGVYIPYPHIPYPQCPTLWIPYPPPMPYPLNTLPTPNALPLEYPTHPNAPPLEYPSHPDAPPLEYPTQPDAPPLEYPTHPDVPPLEYPTQPDALPPDNLTPAPDALSLRVPYPQKEHGTRDTLPHRKDIGPGTRKGPGTRDTSPHGQNDTRVVKITKSGIPWSAKNEPTYVVWGRVPLRDGGLPVVCVHRHVAVDVAVPPEGEVHRVAGVQRKTQADRLGEQVLVVRLACHPRRHPVHVVLHHLHPLLSGVYIKYKDLNVNPTVQKMSGNKDERAISYTIHCAL